VPEAPLCLLYLLIVGKENELTLRVHDQLLDDGQLTEWMRAREVVRLRASHFDEAAPFILQVNFAHVVTARIAATGVSGSATS
jgi:hypothetical protein